jgi:hypothetical protein
MWAALRAESSSMISGQAQFAITAEIVAQFEKEVKQNIQGSRKQRSCPAAPDFEASFNYLFASYVKEHIQ